MACAESARLIAAWRRLRERGLGARAGGQYKKPDKMSHDMALQRMAHRKRRTVGDEGKQRRTRREVACDGYVGHGKAVGEGERREGTKKRRGDPLSSYETFNASQLVRSRPRNPSTTTHPKAASFSEMGAAPEASLSAWVLAFCAATLRS